MRKITRYEIWATFEDGITARVESHKSMRNAEAAIGAMEHMNRADLADGCGFPHGVPTYSIKKVFKLA